MSLFRHLLERLLFLLLTLFIITAVLYAAVMLTPAEQRATLFLPPNLPPRMTEEQYQTLINHIIERNHLNDPYPVQYYYWITSLAQGNWGFSQTLNEGVLDAIIQRSPVTAELTLYSILVFIPLGLISGVIAGSRQNKLADHGFRLTAYIATSLPPFILALVLLAFFYVGLYWFAPGRISDVVSRVVNSANYRQFTGLLTIDGLLNGRPDITWMRCVIW